MPKIIICQGTRSSGKTDWTKQWVLKDPEHRVRFSDDDIRNMLGKHQAPEREVLVNAMRRQSIVAALKKCYDVVIDGTLKPHENDFVKRCVKAHNSTVDELRSLGKLSPQDDIKYSIEYKTLLYHFKSPLMRMQLQLLIRKHINLLGYGSIYSNFLLYFTPHCLHIIRKVLQ